MPIPLPPPVSHGTLLLPPAPPQVTRDQSLPPAQVPETTPMVFPQPDGGPGPQSNTIVLYQPRTTTPPSPTQPLPATRGGSTHSTQRPPSQAVPLSQRNSPPASRSNSLPLRPDDTAGPSDGIGGKGKGPVRNSERGPDGSPPQGETLRHPQEGQVQCTKITGLYSQLTYILRAGRQPKTISFNSAALSIQWLNKSYKKSRQLCG